MIHLPARGSCRCGLCRYIFDAQPFVAYTCHCRECQRLTASAFLTCIQLPAESLQITSGDPATDQRIAESGNSLTTHFCRDCGSTLYIENSARPHVRTLHVGTLDCPESVDVNAHIWVKRKLPWVELPTDHRIFDGAGDWREDYANDPTRYGE
jgi:hypothetical protein